MPGGMYWLDMKRKQYGILLQNVYGHDDDDNDGHDDNYVGDVNDDNN